MKEMKNVSNGVGNILFLSPTDGFRRPFLFLSMHAPLVREKKSEIVHFLSMLYKLYGYAVIRLYGYTVIQLYSYTVIRLYMKHGSAAFGSLEGCPSAAILWA